MSDTPETNAAEERCIATGFKTGYVDVEFALRLERERDEAREVLVEIRDWIDVASMRLRCTFSMGEVAETINSWGDKIRATLEENPRNKYEA